MRKQKQYKFKAKIENGTRGGAFVQIPFDIEKIFGTKGRVKVNVIFDGSVSYRGSLAPMHGKHVLGVRKEIRAKLGKDIGNEISVIFEEDTEPRFVEIPEDLIEALVKNTKVLEKFNDLSYTHKKEFVNWITGAKKPETRKRRIEKTVEMIKEKL